MGLAEILRTEYSMEFDEIRKRMMCTSYYKYGALRENYESEKCIDAVESLKIRLDKYIETGNTEFLADVANFAMIEFMHPRLANAHYQATDDGACGISGFGINEIKGFGDA